MLKTRSMTSPSRLWLILLLGLLLAILLFAKKVTQLSFPGLDIAPKTVVIEPQCPTPEQKEVIRRNMNLYGAGFSQGYDNGIYMSNLISMAKTLGYPDPSRVIWRKSQVILIANRFFDTGSLLPDHRSSITR